MSINELREDLIKAEKIEEMVQEIIGYLDEEDDQNMLERLLSEITHNIHYLLKSEELTLLNEFK